MSATANQLFTGFPAIQTCCSPFKMWNNLDDIPPEPPERSEASKLLFKDYWTATHYSDWSSDVTQDDLIHKDQLFLGDEGVDRMEFYVNHLNEEKEEEEEVTMYPLLDTILEETLEDLMLEEVAESSANSSSTSSSGRWGWGWGWLNTSSDDDDSSSVIHCPNATLPPAVEASEPSKSSNSSTLTGSHDLVGVVDLSHLSCNSTEPEEEDYEEAPNSKKRRIGSSASPSPCPSVTESLIQFEALEKELIEVVDPVFRTSATSAPFEDEVFLDCLEHPEEEEEDWVCSESEEYCESTSSSSSEDEDPSLFCVTNRRKLHSFRSYGDGLHMLNDELDLQSPLEEGSTDEILLNKTRSSTEVLSEDSGYGGVELPPPTICPPDVAPEEEENAVKIRPSPLSLQEAEEFMMNKWPEDLEEGETRSRTSSENDVIHPTAVFSSDGSALLGIASTDLESSKFKLERGEEEEETVGLHSASSSFQTSLDVQRDVTSLETSSEISKMDSAFYPAPVVLKRYGPRQEVEVYITSSSSKGTDELLIRDDANNQQHHQTRGVHFSPVVSSVNWRESYLDQSEDDEEEEEDVTVEDGWQPEEEEEEVMIPSEQEPENKTEKISIELESPPLDGDSGASVVVVSNGTGSVDNNNSNSNNDAGHHNKKKSENLFQRFSLSRLSARMFARKKSSPSSESSTAEMPANTTTDINIKKKNKDVVHPAVSPPEILQDQQQPIKKSNKENGNNKRRFFMIRKPFQRSSSTPPETLIKPVEPPPPPPPPSPPPPPPKVELVESLPPPPIPAARLKKPPLPPRTIAARKNYIAESPPTPPVPQVTSAGLEHALQHFKETARMDRERLANSVPDLLNQPTTVAPPPRPTSDYIDPSSAPAPKPPRHPAPPTASLSISRERARQAAQSRASSVESAWNATATKAALLSSSRRLNLIQPSGGGGGLIQGHAALTRPSVPGLLETNLDAPEFRLSPSKETNLDELIESLQRFRDDPTSATASTTNTNDKRFKSMLNLGSSNSAPVSVQPDINNVINMSNNSNSNNNENNPSDHRAKSMEFLLDEENKSTVQVPENQLQKCGERGLSEHQLRIQRSLQKLNVPEWYKSNARPSLGSTGSSIRRRDQHQSSTRNGGWSGLSSTAASSMTSLSSRSGTPTRVVIPTRVRPDWRNIKSSKESLLSSPAGVESLPPRWGSGRYSYSACPSPSPSNSSCRSSAGLSQQCGRQPYLGWRSQEKLNQQENPSYLSTPAERLAASTVANSTKKPSGDMEEEIRQVTSAIVHYVDGKSRVKESHPLEALSRSPSPRRTRCVWVESSFVGEGIPPVNGHHQEERRPPSRSPLPPVPPPRNSATQIRSTCTTTAQPAGSIAVNVTIEKVVTNNAAAPTLDDVLNSLLGLAPPPQQQIRRPVSQNSITSTKSNNVNNKDSNFDDIRSAGLASR